MKKVTFGTVKLMMPATRIAESKRSGKEFHPALLHQCSL